LLVCAPLEVGMDNILPGPAGGSEQGIEGIRICPRLCIRNNLSPEFSGLGWCSSRPTRLAWDQRVLRVPLLPSCEKPYCKGRIEKPFNNQQSLHWKRQSEFSGIQCLAVWLNFSCRESRC